MLESVNGNGGGPGRDPVSASDNEQIPVVGTHYLDDGPRDRTGDGHGTRRGCRGGRGISATRPPATAGTQSQQECDASHELTERLVQYLHEEMSEILSGSRGDYAERLLHDS